MQEHQKLYILCIIEYTPTTTKMPTMGDVRHSLCCHPVAVCGWFRHDAPTKNIVACTLIALFLFFSRGGVSSVAPFTSAC